MAIEFGKLTAFLGSPTVNPASVQKPVVQPQAYKTAGYTSIPYAKAPQVTDTVPTTDKNGNPLLAGYVTPKNVWVA